MKALALKLLREIGIDTPNADAVVARKLAEPALLYEFVHGLAEQLRARRNDADPRQGWLALPEYEDIPVDAARDSLEDLRARIARLERRIKHYDYARRTPEKLKADKRELRALKRLEVKVVPFFTGAPTMVLDSAVPLLLASRETPKVRRWSRGGKVKAARTKNQ